jgi:hypothetical protein
MEQTFIWKINRKKLVWILAIFTFAFLIFRFYLYYKIKGLSTESIEIDLLIPILDNLVATFLVSLLIAITYLFLKSTEEQIAILDSKSKLISEFERSRKDTIEWRFSGGTGSETRKVTIPFFCSLNNGQNYRTINISIQIINPKNLELCEKYSHYKNSNDEKSDWTARGVQLLIYSTIVSCIYWHQKRQIRIDVYLKNFFSTLRYDISEERVIITKEKPNIPAFLVKKPHAFFDAMKAEFYANQLSSEELDITKCERVFGSIFDKSGKHNLTTEIFQNALKSIGIVDDFTDEELNFIIQHSKPEIGK